MLTIRLATVNDITQLLQVDRHVSAKDLACIIPLGHVLMAFAGTRFVGWLRYGLFQDEIPILNKICLLEEERGKGYGRALVADWESRAHADGRSRVMAVTQANDMAQHFFRQMGYQDAGMLLLPEQAAELFFLKNL